MINSCFLIDNIRNKLLEYLNVSNTVTNIIKYHKDNLHKFGDLSFPLNAFIWHKNGILCEGYCKSCSFNEEEINIFACKFKRKLKLEEEINYLKEHSKKWNIPPINVTMKKGKCLIFLDRPSTFRTAIKLVLDQGIYKINEQCNYDQLESDTQSMSLLDYRKNLIKETIKNILFYLENLNNKFENGNTNNINCNDTINIHCGPLLNPKTKKSTTISLEEYKSQRSVDIQLVAMHKYGVRIRDIERLNDLIKQLTDAAVIIDLLEVKHNSAVNLVKNGQGSSKGATFILYNSARLETLLRKFNEKVESGDYTPLPSVNEIDFTLLKEEEEWKLLFVFIAQFPYIVKRCIEGLEERSCGLHILIQFLKELVAAFSIYYRRIRVLTTYRGHMMPKIHASIYLLKALQEVFNKCLSFLNINPIQYM